MNRSAAEERFTSLTTRQQCRFLVAVAERLTVAARDASLTDTSLLRPLNEIQHKVLGHLARLIDDDKERYPDLVLLASVFEIAERNNCSQQLHYALQHAADRIRETP